MFIPGRQGALQAEMNATVRRNNRLACELPARLDAALGELQAGQPVLVLQRLGGNAAGWHYAVLVGYDAPRAEATLRSGPKKRLRMSAAQFDHTWHDAGCWALVVLPPDELPAETNHERYVRAASVLAKRAIRSHKVIFDAYLRRFLRALKKYFLAHDRRDYNNPVYVEQGLLTATKRP